MPRSVKHGGKKTQRFKNKKNAVTAKKKAMKKKKAKLGCKEIASEWNKDKTVKQNLELMGLAYDVNKAIKLLPNTSASMEVEEMDVEEAAKVESVSEQRKKAGKGKAGKSEQMGKSERVISALEKAVVEEEERVRKGRKFRLLQKDVDFCLYMIKRHDEDYEAMSRDPKNIYQNTPQQIQKKIRIFKRGPEYAKLLKS